MNAVPQPAEISANDTSIPENILIVEFAVMGFIKFIFLITAINNFLYYGRLGYNNRKINKWSDSFCIKMLISIVISINYSAMALILQRCFSLYSYLWLVNSAIWIIAVSLLYFEYRRKLPQSWIGLRLFWLLNGIFYYAKITYTITYYNDDNMYEYITLSLIQAFLSSFLLYYSIFKPRDFEFKNTNLEEIIAGDNQMDIEEGMYKRYDSLHRDEIQITRFDENRQIQVSPGNQLKNSLQVPPLIILSISEIKFRRFSKQGDSLLTRSKVDNFLEKVKLRLSLTINLHAYKNKKPSFAKKGENRNFVVKKSLREIINFNQEILTIIEQKIKIVSPLHIQLKNITDIFRNFDKTKFRNRDMTNSDFDKSLFSEKKDSDLNYKNKIKNLETIFVNLCKNFAFFVPELLKFLDVNDDYIIGNIAKILEKHNSDFDYSNKEWSLNKLISGAIENKSQIENLKKSKISKNSKTKYKDNYSEDFYSDLDLRNETDEHISKTMAYINCILTHDNYITVIVTNLKEKRNLIDSTIVAHLHIKKMNSSLKPNSIEVNIPFKSLIEIVNKQKYQSYPKLRELKTLMTDPRDLLKIKIKNHDYKYLVSELFTRIINDLFYLEEEIFQIFELNKIINSETNHIDDLIILSFFDLNNRNKYLNLALNKFQNRDRNILNYKFSLEFERLEKIQTLDSNNFLIFCLKMMATDVIQSIGSKANCQLEISTYTDYNHSWMVDISLNELDKIISDLIGIITGTGRYCELFELLKKTKSLIEKILKIFITENNNTNSSKEESCRSDALNTERVSSYKSSSSYEKTKLQPTKQINELVEILNRLFVSPYIYIIYCDDIRSIFNLNYIFVKREVNDEEGMDYDKSENAMSNSNKSILENLLD